MLRPWLPRVLRRVAPSRDGCRNAIMSVEWDWLDLTTYALHGKSAWGGSDLYLEDIGVLCVRQFHFFCGYRGVSEWGRRRVRVIGGGVLFCWWCLFGKSRSYCLPFFIIFWYLLIYCYFIFRFSYRWVYVYIFIPHETVFGFCAFYCRVWWNSFIFCLFYFTFVVQHDYVKYVITMSIDPLICWFIYQFM